MNQYSCYLERGTPIACSIASYKALECFLFSSTPRAPILNNEAWPHGSWVPPKDMFTPPTTVAAQY